MLKAQKTGTLLSVLFGLFVAAALSEPTWPQGVHSLEHQEAPPPAEGLQRHDLNEGLKESPQDVTVEGDSKADEAPPTDAEAGGQLQWGAGGAAPSTQGNGVDVLVSEEEVQTTPEQTASMPEVGVEGDSKADEAPPTDAEAGGQLQWGAGGTAPSTQGNGAEVETSEGGVTGTNTVFAPRVAVSNTHTLQMVGDAQSVAGNGGLVEEKSNDGEGADRVVFEMMILMREHDFHIPWECNSEPGFMKDMTSDSVKRTLATSAQCRFGLSLALRQALSTVLKDSKSRDEEHKSLLANLGSLKDELERTRAQLNTADQRVSELLQEAAEAKTSTAALGEEQQNLCMSNMDTAAAKHAKIESELRAELQMLSNTVKEAEDHRRALESTLDEKTKLLAQTEALHEQALTDCAEMKRVKTGFNENVMIESVEGSEVLAESTKCERGETKNMDLTFSRVCSGDDEDVNVEEESSRLSFLAHDDVASTRGGSTEKNTTSASTVLQKIFIFVRGYAYKALSVSYPLFQSIMRRVWASPPGIMLENGIAKVVSRVKLFGRRVDGILGTSLEQQHENIASAVQATIFLLLLVVIYLLRIVWHGMRAFISRLTRMSSSTRDGADGKNIEKPSTSAGDKNFSIPEGYQGSHLAGGQHQPSVAMGGSDLRFAAGGINTVVPPNPPSVPVMQNNAIQQHADPIPRHPEAASWKPPSFVRPPPHVDHMQIPQQPPSLSTGQYGQGPPNRLYGGPSGPPRLRRPPGAPPPRALPPHVAPGFRAPGPPRGPPRRPPPQGATAVGLQPPNMRVVGETQKNV